MYNGTAEARIEALETIKGELISALVSFIDISEKNPDGTFTQKYLTVSDRDKRLKKAKKALENAGYSFGTTMQAKEKAGAL